MKEIWLSPSDLSYLWNDSKLGFYDKYVMGVQRPSQPFPGVFNSIMNAMKECFEGKTLSQVYEKDKFGDICNNAPSGTVYCPGMYVKSKLIDLGEFKVGFSGKINCLLKDGEDVSVFDFRTIENNPKLAENYFLHYMAYALCLENPLVGDPQKVSNLGMVTYNPKSFGLISDSGSLSGDLEWVSVPINKEKFKKWIVTDLKSLLMSKRENIFQTATDKSYEKYVDAFFEGEE